MSHPKTAFVGFSPLSTEFAGSPVSSHLHWQVILLLLHALRLHNNKIGTRRPQIRSSITSGKKKKNNLLLWALDCYTGRHSLSTKNDSSWPSSIFSHPLPCQPPIRYQQLMKAQYFSKESPDIYLQGFIISGSSYDYALPPGPRADISIFRQHMQK